MSQDNLYGNERKELTTINLLSHLRFLAGIAFHHIRELKLDSGHVVLSVILLSEGIHPVLISTLDINLSPARWALCNIL